MPDGDITPRDMRRSDGPYVTTAADLHVGDVFRGVYSGRVLDGIRIESVRPDLKGRIRVTFEGGRVCTYEPSRKVLVADA